MLGLEGTDLVDDMAAMTGHRLGVPDRLAVLDGGSRAVGDKCSHAHVVGLISQMGELFVDDTQFVAQAA